MNLKQSPLSSLKMQTFPFKIIFVSLFFLIYFSDLRSQNSSFVITVDQPIHGSIKLSPALPPNGAYAAGTVITATAIADAGYTLDGGYFSTPGRFGQSYTEFMTNSFKVTADQNKHIGASFIDKKLVENIKVTQDVVFAKPGKKVLKYDVYSPKGAKNLPAIIIIHGGGWSVNNEDVMRGLARELVKGGKYVVFSIDYRWIQKLDGDEVDNTMSDLIDDVFGAIAHIMEHAEEYGADSSNIALTGDSAGGQLSAFCANAPNKIGDGGFGKTPGVFEFMPSYLPKNKTIGQVRSDIMAAIKAVAPSYGGFSANVLQHYSNNPAADSSWNRAIAPLSNIPDAKVREIPQYLTRGSVDFLIKDEYVKVYLDGLAKAGQRAEYVQIAGANHAFFDWKPDASTKATFAKFGVYCAAEMKNFFNSVFYPSR